MDRVALAVSRFTRVALPRKWENLGDHLGRCELLVISLELNEFSDNHYDVIFS